MDKQQAQDIVKATFESPFDKGRFTRFVKNLLNHIDESKSFPKPLTGSYIKESFRDRIKNYDRIGRFIDASGKVIDILTVCLHREKSLAQARTSQRNFISGYLRGDYGSSSSKDAAVVAFYCEDTTDWRFSLVTIDHVIDVEKLKVKQEFSSAKRFSFLVGENESSHTAQSRLTPILADDEHNPTLTELEEAFNIEKVTKEFFEKYRDLFLRTKETLDEVVAGDKNIKADFEAKGVNTVDFAKKLLGQIVFLYFLQKKGWFGVKRDAEWRTGTKHFLRELFEGRHGTYTNFFNDILEPLFYEALRIDRSHDDGYYSRFNCKIPFLNGGLFDPINNYDWVHTDIILPNELFSNTLKTKEGDTGNGILDIFDRYNFTVKEDEPLEKEVAVDPEMLGKVFENLLEVKDRKSKGTYYTPREIVHYMCQQSLINYLYTTLNEDKFSVTAEPLPSSVIPAGRESFLKKDAGQAGMTEKSKERVSNNIIPCEDLETLIKYGEQVGENEAIAIIKAQKITEGKQQSTKIKHLLPESIRQNAKLIDEKLANIKVCDPAIGSGAFPVGMMSEIVKTRQTLTNYFPTLEKGPACPVGRGKGGFSHDRTIYNFKRGCIEKCLYGVDIDPGAVEIAKLRLWLSLMVDEEDIKQIKPLPNLDYKIVCGNSLLGVNMMFHHQALLKLEDLKGKFFEETNPKKKTEFKNDIDNLIREITNDDKHFDFKVYFSEVFHVSSNSPLTKGAKGGCGGFDIVIANPPYVRHEAIKDMKPELKKQFGEFFCGTADIYTYFYHRGLDVLKSDGHLCFIAPNKFMRAGYGKNTRVLLSSKASPKVVIDFCELPVFEAGTDPAIVLVEKTSPTTDTNVTVAIIKTAAEIERISDVVTQRGFAMMTRDLAAEGWTLESANVLVLLDKLRKAGKPLGEYVHGRFYRGILTGLNEAFVINESTRKKLIAEDSKSAELIKPWLDGHDILKWKGSWDNRYVIAIASSNNRQWPWSDEKSEQKARAIFKKTYPAIHGHFSQWEEDLMKRDDQGKFWWELRSCSYYEEFDKPKIVFNETSKELHAYVDYKKVFINKTGFIIISPENEYLLAILNSRLMDYYFRHNFPAWGDPWKGGRVQFRKDRMVLVPVISATDKQKAPIITLVNQILTAKKKHTPQSHLDRGEDNADTSALERQIDEMVYALYNLTPEEIAIVEGKG